MLPRMAALDSDVTAALTPAPSVAVKKEGLAAVPVFPASLVAMKMKKTTAAVKMKKTTAAVKMKKTTAAMKIKETTEVSRHGDGGGGIPIAKSTGLPDRRYSTDGRHGNGGGGIPIAKSTGEVMKETTAAMKETTAAMKETMATIQKSLAGKLETTTAMKMKSVLFPTLEAFVFTFTELVLEDFPSIENVKQLLSDARKCCSDVMGRELFWQMVEQDICSESGFSDEVLGKLDFIARFSEVSLKLVVTSLGLAYKMVESGICVAHVFHCFLLGVEYDCNDRNEFNGFKLYCFLNDANMVFVNGVFEAHQYYIDDAGILQTGQVRKEIVPVVLQYGFRAVSEMNTKLESKGQTFRFEVAALDPTACTAFEHSLIPFMFS